MPRPPRKPESDKEVNGTTHEGRLEIAYRSFNLYPWHNRSRSFYGQPIASQSHLNLFSSDHPSDAIFVIFSRDAKTDIDDVIAYGFPLSLSENKKTVSWKYLKASELNPTQAHHVVVLRHYFKDPDLAPYITLSGELPYFGIGRHNRRLAEQEYDAMLAEDDSDR